jgi:hypothetical protein
MVWAEVQARIRRDGGPVSAVRIYWPKRDCEGVEVYDPRTAEEIAREVRWNGGEAEVVRMGERIDPVTENCEACGTADGEYTGRYGPVCQTCNDTEMGGRR